MVVAAVIAYPIKSQSVTHPLYFKLARKFVNKLSERLVVLVNVSFHLEFLRDIGYRLPRFQV